MKKAVIIGICLIVCLSGLLLNSMKKQRVLYYAIYPSGKTSRTHVFEFFNDGTMQYFYGTRNSEIINEIEFKKIFNSKKIKLCEDIIIEIKKFSEELNKCGSIDLDDMCYDCWETVIITNKHRINKYLINSETKCEEILIKLFFYIEMISSVKFEMFGE